uniref:uncharacterized protein n=1 Tax=Centroberyx gerrardi TaxID=166262 RepID=UPI003AAE69FF
MMKSSVVFFLAVSFAMFGFGFGNNVAVGGNVTQSSVYDTAVPERAIDGNRASNWDQGSCTHTQADFKPWWRLDLLKSYKISNVTITNREDCCPERINGAEIRTGDSLNDNGNTNPRCAVISSIPAGSSQTFKCDMEGRYVNIVIPGRKEYLTLCEVEVYGEVVEDSVPSGNNIAVGGNVTQSSVYDNAVPERAIDGNRASHLAQDSCTHTQADFKPWWRLDLLKSYKVNYVTITNREDCCPERINGAEIRIGDSLNDNGNTNPRCVLISSIPAVTSQTFKCNGMEGRYVNIVIPGRNEYLTLCEVEVYGEVVEDSVPSGNNVAVGGNYFVVDSVRSEAAELGIMMRSSVVFFLAVSFAVFGFDFAVTSQTFKCKGMEGRYVNIVNSDSWEERIPDTV